MKEWTDFVSRRYICLVFTLSVASWCLPGIADLSIAKSPVHRHAVIYYHKINATQQLLTWGYSANTVASIASIWSFCFRTYKSERTSIIHCTSETVRVCECVSTCVCVVYVLVWVYELVWECVERTSIRCTCVWVCGWMYVRTCVWVCVWEWVWVYVFQWVSECLCAHKHTTCETALYTKILSTWPGTSHTLTHTHSLILTHTYIHPHSLSHTHSHTRTYVHSPTHSHTRTPTHTHSHTYTHTKTYTTHTHVLTHSHTRTVSDVQWIIDVLSFVGSETEWPDACYTGNGVGAISPG